jgi:nucleoside-diphosphate-sugar epimerase
VSRLIVTGASGYIGRRLVAMAGAQGHDVLVLGGEQLAGADFRPWRLGEDVGLSLLAGKDAMIHLAHDWRADAAGKDLNVAGTERLARAALDGGVSRFVFASSVSARPTALNVYGRAKYSAERRLADLSQDRGRLAVARIGLVYGGAAGGQYARLRQLTALTPILPMVGQDREVQPVHLDDVCQGLLTIALDHGLAKPCYVVAGTPMRFGRWLRLLRRVQTGKGLWLLPVPLGPMLLAARLGGPGLRERILGLAGTAPMPGDLAELNIEAQPPEERLRRDEAANPAEARALLRYLGTRPTPEMERDLVAGLTDARLSPLHLPRLMVRYPFLVTLVEPPANRQANPLAAALYLAAQVREAYAPAARPGWRHVGLHLLAEILALPLRLTASRRPR